MTPEPTKRILSLGAGVQSTALLILAARGQFEPIDAAIFSDTGWEPRGVYEHLDRLEEEVAKPNGIPVYRVSTGDIRRDALDPEKRFASMPLYVMGPCVACGGSMTEDVPERTKWELDSDAYDDVREEDFEDGDGIGEWVTMPAYSGPCRSCKGGGTQEGMVRRQCTSEYKLKPIKAKVRELLGAEPREDGAPGRVPKGNWAEQWIGFSTDEAHRRLDTNGPGYMVSRWPLIEAGLSRSDCEAINIAAGFGAQKSACIGCPFHGNRQWRQMRDNDPESWAEAVQFDRDIRNGSARANAQGNLLRGEYFLHRSRVPLDQAPIDHVTRRENIDAQLDLLDVLSAEQIEAAFEDEDAEIVGCGPFTCRTSDLAATT